MWVILLNHTDWDCFKTLSSREILKIRNPLLEESYAFLWRSNIFPISWMCKKQTSVSHSSTESEIISLDARLRLDGIPALDLWDLIFLSLETQIRTMIARRDPMFAVIKNHVRQQSRGVINTLDNVDPVPPNVQSPHQEALVYVFEDNEAVIKMIKKGRSPTMRHVSRTHRVALDWLFDRINLDHQNPNQIH